MDETTPGGLHVNIDIILIWVMSRKNDSLIFKAMDDGKGGRMMTKMAPLRNWVHISAKAWRLSK